jgi:hypothetical protein
MCYVFSVYCVLAGCRLVTASNATAYTPSVFKSLLSGDCLTTTPRLTAISHKPPALLTAVSGLSSLYSLGTDRIGNTSPNSSLVASRNYRMDGVENTASQLLHCSVLRICCLATGVFAESFPSNGCFCWLHSSCLEQICHSCALVPNP